MGCGPDSPAGLAMEIRRDGDEVVTDIVFDHRQAGAPGARALRGGRGRVRRRVRLHPLCRPDPRVTKTLQVDYRSPVPLGEPHRIRARLVEREGRKLHMAAEGAAPDGSVRFTATALFMEVPRSHFEAFGTFEDHPGLSRLEADG